MEEKKNIPQDLSPIQVSVKVNAPIEKVWEAITNPNQMRHWCFDIQKESIENGDTFTFYEPGGKNEYLHECLVLDFDENTLFRHTWAYPEISQGSSTVSWDLEKQGDITEVILTHEGTEHLLDAGDVMARENFVEGWSELLRDLKKFVEN